VLDILHSSDSGEKWDYNETVYYSFTYFEKACDSGEKYCTVLALNWYTYETS